MVGVPAGALDSDPGVRPEFAFYTESAAGWCAPEVTGGAYAQMPPSEFLAEFMGRLR